MNSSSKPLQFCVLLASGVMLCGAAAVWSSKSRDLSLREAKADQAHAQRHAEAAALIFKSYNADNGLSYSALSHTVAYIGGKSLESTALVSRAPHHLVIKMLSGPMQGVQSGYSQRWSWRQETDGVMHPYAQSALDADQIAAQRFALMVQNYDAVLMGQQSLEGRPASVVELRPIKPCDDAKGPARRLYIDQQSGLTLRIDSFNCDLKPVMRSSLSKLNLNPHFTGASFQTPAAILASLKNKDWRGEELGADFKSAAQKTGFMPPQPSVLPPGFVLEGYGVHRCRTTGTLQLSAFSRYTDGLNSLMIFAFKPVNADIAKNMRGICDFGPGAMSSREDNGGRLVALGDLPFNTLQRVLISAKFETAK